MKKLSCKDISRELLKIANNDRMLELLIYNGKFECRIDGLTIRCNGTKSDILRVAEKYSKPLPGNKPFNARRAYTELNTVGPYEWWRTDRKSNLSISDLADSEADYCKVGVA